MWSELRQIWHDIGRLSADAARYIILGKVLVANWSSNDSVQSRDALHVKRIICFSFNLEIFWCQTCGSLNVNPLNPAGRFSGLRKQGAKNPAGRFSGICYGVSKTRRACKLAHINPIINWFVYTGRYQATLRSQVESSTLFSFRTICNLLRGFCTRCTILRRKYGGDTQCMWRYRYSLNVVDNVEELYSQKIRFWDRNGGIQCTC